MKILLVVATHFEIAPLLQNYKVEKLAPNFYSFNTNRHSVFILQTGIGPIFTCFEMTRHLANNSYDLLINAGICGSFTNRYSLGEVVEITSDEFADLGIDDNGTFKTLFDMGFLDPNTAPFQSTKLHATYKLGEQTIQKASAITVSKTNGSNKSIELVSQKFGAETESMEGASFFYVGLQFGIPSCQIRSVSNYVEARNSKNWKIELAIKNLNLMLVDFLGR